MALQKVRGREGAVAAIVINPACDDCGGRTGGQRGRQIIATVKGDKCNNGEKLSEHDSHPHEPYK
jgi:hypothetical protein